MAAVLDCDGRRGGHGHGGGLSIHPDFPTPHSSWRCLLSSPVTDTQGQIHSSNRDWRRGKSVGTRFKKQASDTTWQNRN